MKIKICLSIFLVQSIGLFASFSSPEANTTVNVKQKVNFSGTLLTHQGTKFNVDNISINNKIRKITVVDKPDKKKLAQPIKNEKTHKQEIVLTEDPLKEYVEIGLDLSETKEIHAIADPLYTYKQDSKHHSIEFIEIEVISNDKKKTKHSYLIDNNAHIFCDQINDAGPIEMKTPIAAVDKLSIDGYSYRDGTTAGALPNNTTKLSETDQKK